MPPAPQAAQLAGQKQSQQQYDPSTGPPVQNAASLHTPPPQLPGRLPSSGLSAVSLPPAPQFPQPQVVEPQVPLHMPVKTQQPDAPVHTPPPSRAPTSLQPAQPAPHALMPGRTQGQASLLAPQPQVLCAPVCWWGLERCTGGVGCTLQARFL